MRVVFLNASEAFKYLYAQVMKHGNDFAGNKTLFHTSFRILNPAANIITTSWRKFNLNYARKEWLWYLSGDRSIEQVQDVAIWRKVADDFGEVNSNYGWHWKQNWQYNRMLLELKKHKSSRRAILSHYDYNDLDRYSKDTPCNIYLSFQIVQDELLMSVHCRSQDLVYGFCNDQYIWSNLQMKIVTDLFGYYPALTSGYCHYFIDNLHVYPRHFNLK